jgi:hypothetical protein
MVLVLFLLSVMATVRFRIEGHFHGLFLLKGSADYRLELKDDLYLGDGYRFITGFEFTPWRDIRAEWFGMSHETPFLSFEWLEKDGTGFVVNHLNGGQLLFTSFSRFEDATDKNPSGLFVGGGLPHAVMVDKAPFTNESGMAYNDGARWFHIWCSANESILSSRTLEPIYPSMWKYLGSKVVHSSEREILIQSAHIVEVEHIPLKIERFAHFKAGETFFTLSFRVTNIGNKPVEYDYLYGDEPWLGNYGSSAGNIGWVKDRLINHVGPVDTAKYRYAGMFDFGNDAINEGHDFSGTANFIEWMSGVEAKVYFSNGPLQKHDAVKDGVEPLQGNERYIGIQWQAPPLAPGKSDTYFLAIGMAGRDPKTGFPVKPKTGLYP